MCLKYRIDIYAIKPHYSFSCIELKYHIFLVLSSKPFQNKARLANIFPQLLIHAGPHNKK
jgi:hypothetical protein